jgi:hypothetical protein
MYPTHSIGGVGIPSFLCMYETYISRHIFYIGYSELYYLLDDPPMVCMGSIAFVCMHETYVSNLYYVRLELGYVGFFCGWKESYVSKVILCVGYIDPQYVLDTPMEGYIICDAKMR